MELNPTIEQFYTSILDYSGITVENNILVNKNDKLGDITVNEKHISLPYLSVLKNPDNKIIFHLLNENYTSPETTLFNLYKKRLVLELNLKLSSLIISLISVASDVQLQQKIKSSKLIELVNNIGEIDHSYIESFLNLVKASKKVNNEAFILDVYLKKNGEIKDVPYAAIGKINFHMYSEIEQALNNKDKEYKAFGYKLRKKDLLAFINIFNVVFPNINTPEAYVEGTDNKIFRYLNILLKTSYEVSSRVNELVRLLEELKEPCLNLDEVKFNLDWVKSLETLYSMAAEIRLIPNQVDIVAESNKLKVDESAAQRVQNTPMQFEPAKMQAAQQPQYQQPIQQSQQPQVAAQLSPEDIIRGNLNPQMMQPIQQPYMYAPPAMNNTFVPAWVQQEQMRTGQQVATNMYPNTLQAPGMTQQGWMHPGMLQQGMPQQGMMHPGMMQQNMPQQGMMHPGMMQQGMPQQGMMHPGMMQQGMQQQGMMQGSQHQGLQVNPHFVRSSNAPWG